MEKEKRLDGRIKESNDKSSSLAKKVIELERRVKQKTGGGRKTGGPEFPEIGDGGIADRKQEAAQKRTGEGSTEALDQY